MGPNTTLEGAQTCHYFNLTIIASTGIISTFSKSTAAATISTSTNIVAFSPTSFTMSTSTSLSSPSQTIIPSPGTSPSTGIIIRYGLAIGLGLGIPLVLLVIGLFGWKIYKSHSMALPQQRNMNMGPEQSALSIQSPPVYPFRKAVSRTYEEGAEIQGNQQRPFAYYELPEGR